MHIESEHLLQCFHDLNLALFILQQISWTHSREQTLSSIRGAVYQVAHIDFVCLDIGEIFDIDWQLEDIILTFLKSFSVSGSRFATFCIANADTVFDIFRSLRKFVPENADSYPVELICVRFLALFVDTTHIADRLE